MWFQDSTKTNYALEKLRLLACLKKVLSPSLAKFYMENCLINLSEKGQGFMPCDMVIEYVVREIKSLIDPSFSPASDERLRNKISLLVMHLRDWRRNMAKKVEAKNDNNHSTKSR